jgi:hypothetical protein
MSIDFDQIRFPTTGHSATVKMTLYAGSSVISVLQSSRDSIKVAEGQNVPVEDAVLETVVDGRVHRRMVRVIGTGSAANWVDIADR